MIRPYTTPGAGEYLLAYLASIGCFAALAVIPGVLFDADGHIVEMFLVMCMYTSILSIPFAAVGVPLVHVLSRKARGQGAQVAITGAVTVVVVGAGLALLSFGELPNGLRITAMTTIATMAGRAAVIPLLGGARRPKSHPWEWQHP